MLEGKLNFSDALKMNLSYRNLGNNLYAVVGDVDLL